MRLALPLAALVAAGAVSGCVSVTDHGDGYASSYAREMRELVAQCDARGGILTPIPGAHGPRPANDYACEIHGGGSGRLD